MSCSVRKKTALLSRSANTATSTLAPVTSSRPEDCTCTTARWITRWKPAVGLGFAVLVEDEVGKLLVDEIGQLGPQPVQIDVAGPHDRRRVPVVDQRQEQVFQRGVFVMALVGIFDGAMERLFQAV